VKEMKTLEFSFYVPEGMPVPVAPRGPQSVSNIVPVTGLIVNRLHRLENELSTVLEKWKSLIPVKPVIEKELPLQPNEDISLP